MSQYEYIYIAVTVHGHVKLLLSQYSLFGLWLDWPELLIIRKKSAGASLRSNN